MIKPKPKWGAIPSISAHRRKRVAEYTRERKFFLAANPWCAWGLAQQPPVKIRSTEIHHLRGRAGRLLLDQRFWLAVSAKGHDWIHHNVKLARARGLICDYGQWNTVPKDPFPLSGVLTDKLAAPPIKGRTTEGNP